MSRLNDARAAPDVDHGVFTLDDDVRTLVDLDVDHGTRTLDDDATLLDAVVDHGTCTLVDLDVDDRHW